jgi:hypothetical protein
LIRRKEMPFVSLLLAALDGRGRMASVVLLRAFFILGDIAGFFTNLYGQITLFALAFSTFFFAWAALLYGASGTSGDQRARAHAMGALYAALAGLALALLAGTVAGIISTAAKGQ